MGNKDQRTSLLADVGLLMFLVLFSATAILMSLSGQVLLNVIYLFGTVALLMLTYFFGIMPSLIANILFIAMQATIMVYQYVAKGSTIHWQLAFWMVIPILLCLTLYCMTYNQLKLQDANAELRTAMVEQGAFDEQTHLRTTVAYMEDTAVYAETNKRFQLPVTTAVIKIGYYNDIRRMMSEHQVQSLLQMTTDAIKDKTRINDIIYLVNNDDPTWAILLFSNADGTTIATNRVKEGFDERLKNNPDLSTMAISLVVGIASWDGEKMKTPYDLLNAAVRETQYDV
ncbi:GGDEF domain-containing protein [Companilactobacillus allii]|uniref:GGDEF domain-containing protein n=1 Tax=Companilactobacillus allii TaxID=1847728 RepID=A0A1P8Q5P8_9LACO|nr:GGDEF domain-containing protein [Companilactobacillus allii]APX73170.1 GGDEF domain-containing protein [Companilactobacillus allii]USQ67977.1 GGDEF domain-containing protein [Companilactobacillus allii]